MAKKNTQKYVSNNFDIDSDLDIPDFDFEAGEISGDRNPVTTVAKATLKGASEAVINPSVIRSTIRKTMPKEYGDAMELADEAANSMRSLYDTAAKEFRPVANDLKRITGKVIPSVEGVLPKKIADSLKKWSKGEERYGVDLSAQRQRDDTVLMELGQIFKAQAEVEDKKSKSEERREQFQQGIDQIRHRDQISQLDSIRIGIDRLTTYQDNVLSNYQKKSLELQFRQYFATVDILEVQKKQAADIDTKLQGIMKNTAMPEFVKINESERFSELARNKFYSDIRDSLFGDQDGAEYIKKFFSNIRKSLTEKIQNTAQSMQQVTFGLDMMTDGASDGMGPSKAEIVGGLAGNLAGNYAVKRGQDYLKRKLKDNPALAKGAENISYRIKNSGQLMDDYFNDYDNNWGAFEGLRQFLDENRPGVGPAVSMDADSLGIMHKPMPFTRAASKSITEIIPGFLSRIYRELQVIRTGDESVGLTTYDFESNKFAYEKSIGSKLLGGLASEDNRKMVKERQDELLKLVDPDGKLTAEQRKAVSDQFLRMSLRRQSTDARNLADSYTWRKAGSGSHQIADIFAQLMEVGPDGKRGDSLEAIRNQNRISNAVRGLTQGISDPRAQIQEMINAGQYDVLRNSGLLDDDNRVSLENLARVLSGESLDSISKNDNAALAGKGGFRTAKPRVFSKSIARVENTASISQDETTAKRLAELQDLIKEPPTLGYVKTIAEMVTRIEERLGRGLMVYGDTTGRLSFDEFTGPLKPDWITQQLGKVKKKWSDVSLGDIGEGIRNTALKGLAYGRRKFRSLSDYAKGAYSRARDVLGDSLQKAADKMGDIYVGDELTPRLTRAKMLAGEYFDQATGKPITSLLDIRGVVVDKAGNVILSIEDLKIAKLRGKVTEYLKDKVKGIGELVSKAAMYTGGLVKGLYGQMLTGAIMGVQLIKKHLPPYDVYVADQMDKPVLYATQFRLNQYFSQKTGEPLRHPRDIDGPVLDRDGNIVLTEEMIQKGIVDRHGIAVSNVVGRAINKAKNMALAGFGLLKKLGSKAKDIAFGAFASIGELFKGLFKGFSYYGERYVEINKDQLDVQLEILKVLKERLPKRAVGDTDGDGDREGSIEDIVRRRQAEKEAKAAKLSEQAAATANGQAAGGAGIFGALSGLIKKNTEAVEEAAEAADGGLLDDAADIADIADAAGDMKRGGRVPKAGRMGKLGRLGGMAKGAASKSWGLAKGAGRFAANSAGRVFGLGSLLGGVGGKLAGATGRAALWTAGRAGSLALGAGKLGAAALMHGGTVGVARAAAAALMGSLFSPISLAALGLTAAYYGYKYLTRKTLETLNKVRYVQYGFSNSDKDHVQTIFELEDKLEPHVNLEGEKASINEGKLDLKDIMKPFGIDAENREGLSDWSYWFRERFLPVYLAHKSALAAIKPELKIADVDSSKLKPEEKLRYLGAVELPNGPYDRMISPFKDLERLVSDGRAVQAQIEIARTEIEKDAKNGKAGTTTAAAAATAGTAAAQLAKGDAADATAKADGSGAVAAAGLAGLAADLNKPATTMDAGAKVTAQSSVSADYLFTGDKGQLDALTTIRYKTYGLTTMDAEKVRALRYLEVYVERNTQFDKDGARYAQDVETLLEVVKVHFGISGARSPRGYKWITWFRARFLPVFLNFATAVEKATKKKDIVDAERALTPEQAISVASAIYSTTTVYNGRNTSVWNVVDDSPWDGYALNSNEKSIELNLEALKETAKAVIRGEQKSAKINQQVSDNRKKAVEAGTMPDNKVMSETAGGAAIVYRKPPGLTQKQIAQSSVDGNNRPEAMRSDGVNVRGKGDFMTGVPVKHPGAGTGGDINALPDIGTSNGWQAVRPLLLAVAKMTGVDPKVLVNMAAIESGFNPLAKAGTSSATGLFQFINSTWNQQLREHGKKYGIAIGTPATDARANALMGAEFIKSNMEYLKRSIKRPLTNTDVYLAHFLGPAGAAKFLSMDPNTPAASVMPKEAQANYNVFFDRSGRMRTAGEIYAHFTKKMEKQGNQFGVKDSDFGSSSMVDAKDSLAPNESVVPNKPSTQAAKAVTDVAAAPIKTSAAPSVNGSPMPVPGAASSMVQPTNSSKPVAAEPPVQAPTPPVPLRSAPGFTGFQPTMRPTPQELKAQDEAARSGLVQGIGDISRTLSKSLIAQEAAVELLKQIAGTMPMKSGASSVPQTVSTPQPSKEAPKAAVSMSRG